jgi:hypothetical protein
MPLQPRLHLASDQFISQSTLLGAPTTAQSADSGAIWAAPLAHNRAAAFRQVARVCGSTGSTTAVQERPETASVETANTQ